MAAVTGSKGKGSVANMISEILQTEFNVGLMTSPHIIKFNERFRFNRTEISDEDLIKFVNSLKEEVDMLDLQIPDDKYISPMGIQAAIALKYFKDLNSDINVFECGKGVKYDDVNNVPHEYSVINTIFLEHVRELGNTLSEIAWDKAHIITGEQKVVYTAEQNDEVMKNLKDRCALFGTKLKVYGTDFVCRNIKFTKNGMVFDVVTKNGEYNEITLPLLGVHQSKNCALAIAVCEDILKALDVDKMRANLRSLRWSGRMEVLSDSPFVILDACINRESCKMVTEVLRNMNINGVSAIIGIPDDKDFAGVADEISAYAKRIILTRSDNTHYVFTDVQKKVLEEKGFSVISTDSVKDAISIASQFDDPVCILGTTSVITNVKEM